MGTLLTIQLLAELHQEFNHLLHGVYINIKADFYLVDRSTLWLMLKGDGVADVLLNIIEVQQK